MCFGSCKWERHDGDCEWIFMFGKESYPLPCQQDDKNNHKPQEVVMENKDVETCKKDADNIYRRLRWCYTEMEKRQTAIKNMSDEISELLDDIRVLVGEMSLLSKYGRITEKM